MDIHTYIAEIVGNLIEVSNVDIDLENFEVVSEEENCVFILSHHRVLEVNEDNIYIDR